MTILGGLLRRGRKPQCAARRLDQTVMDLVKEAV